MENKQFNDILVNVPGSFMLECARGGSAKEMIKNVLENNGVEVV